MNEHGRELDRFGWYVWIFLNIDADGESAREQAARSMGGIYDQDFRPIVAASARERNRQNLNVKLVIAPIRV